MPSQSSHPAGMLATDPDHIKITPLGTRFNRLFATNAVVAICVLLVPLAAVGAVAMPVNVLAPLIDKLPPVMLPAADTAPEVFRLLPVTVPVADIKPLASKLAPCTLPLADISVAFMFAVETLLVAFKLPVDTFAEIIDPVALISPIVLRLPACTFPVTDSAVRLPRLVINGCAAVNTVPDRVVEVMAVAKTVPVVIVSLTSRFPCGPISVILGWDPVCKVPLINVAVTVPAVTVPVQLTEDRIPTPVMLG